MGLFTVEGAIGLFREGDGGHGEGAVELRASASSLDLTLSVDSRPWAHTISRAMTRSPR